MTTIHKNKEEAIEMLEEWLKEPLVLKRLISNLKQVSIIILMLNL